MSEKRNKVHVEGIRNFEGNLENADVTVEGVSQVKNLSDEQVNSGKSYGAEGKEYENTIKVEGVSNVKGNLVGKEVKIQGVAKCGGSIECKVLNIQGVLRVEGGISAYCANIEGVISVKGDVTAERVCIEGAPNIKGLLNAEEIEIEFESSKSTIREIGGEKIKIRKTKNKGHRLFKNRHRIESDVIEGVDIDIENTWVDIVRGENVIIGRDCKIDRVEYTDTLEVHPDAEVKEKVKV